MQKDRLKMLNLSADIVYLVCEQLLQSKLSDNELHDLYSLVTRLGFIGLQKKLISKNKRTFIERACDTGDVSLLKWWLASGLEIDFVDISIYCASLNGHIDVLDWWKESGLELKCDTNTVSKGIYRPKTHDFLKDSGMCLNHKKPIDYACRRGHVAVLDWWKNSGMPIEYDDPITYASIGGHIQVLEWLKSSGWSFCQKYDWLLEEISYYGQADVLKWWQSQGMTPFIPITDDWGFRRGARVNWNQDTQFELKYTVQDIMVASARGHVNVANWWKNSGLELYCKHDGIIMWENSREYYDTHLRKHRIRKNKTCTIQ